MQTTIAIIGDFDSYSQSHIATNKAIDHCSAAIGVPVEYVWIPTAELASSGGLDIVRKCSGLWIAPGSPYRSLEGALSAICAARKEKIPLLGTCGGFQHVILEYARNVLGFADAQHAEYDPYASRLFISRLVCSLVGRKMTIELRPESKVAAAYGKTCVEEQYYCNFGVNPDYTSVFRAGSLRIVGSDKEGELRVVELEDHPFFVGTLFLPQQNSSPQSPHPLIEAFLRAAER
jgi:CTP synthase (UTP-ammonia lyase)